MSLSKKRSDEIVDKSRNQKKMKIDSKLLYEEVQTNKSKISLPIIIRNSKDKFISKSIIDYLDLKVENIPIYQCTRDELFLLNNINESLNFIYNVEKMDKLYKFLDLIKYWSHDPDDEILKKIKFYDEICLDLDKKIKRIETLDAFRIGKTLRENEDILKLDNLIKNFEHYRRKLFLLIKKNKHLIEMEYLPSIIDKINFKFFPNKKINMFIEDRLNKYRCVPDYLMLKDWLSEANIKFNFNLNLNEITFLTIQVLEHVVQIFKKLRQQDTCDYEIQEDVEHEKNLEKNKMMIKIKYEKIDVVNENFLNFNDESVFFK